MRSVRTPVTRLTLALACALACALPSTPATAYAQRAAADSLPRDSVPAAAPLAAVPPGRACTAERPLRSASPDAALPHCIARVEVFADGNVKDVLGGGKANGVASGSLGLHYVGSRYDVTGLVTVVGPGDTVRTHYGSAVLLPAIGSGLNAAAAIVRGRWRDWGDMRCADVNYSLLCNIGFRVHADASTSRWATQTRRVAPPAGETDSVSQVVATADVPIWGLGAGVSYSFFAGDLRTSDNESRSVEMILDAGVTRRAMRGDLSGRSAALDSARANLLGSTSTSFGGYQIGLTLVYHQVRSSFTYVRLRGSVPGLTGGQIVAIVDLRAALASGLLRRS